MRRLRYAAIDRHAQAFLFEPDPAVLQYLSDVAAQ